MTLDAIRLVGDPVLRTATEPVTTFDADLARLVRRMFDAMYDADGVGLAANQIGVGLRLFVYEVEDGEPGLVVNPVLQIDPDAPLETELEGCLSVPGSHQLTPRAARATVSGVDVHGEPVTVAGEGLLARCLQHEVDHLDGRLYVDLLDPRIRRAALDAVADSSAGHLPGDL